MKPFITILLSGLISISVHAQLDKGDRILAWQVDMAEDADYFAAYSFAQSACMESIHLFFPWSGIEVSKGNFDSIFISNTLDIVDYYHPLFNTKAELQIATLNTVAKEVPIDLMSVDFDDPQMINRFLIFLDTLFAHIPNLELTSLNIGNEGDIFMGNDLRQYQAYKTFLNAVIPHAKQLYFDLHGEDLKVGTTFTLDGLIDDSKSSLCKLVNESLDIIATTYYPLNSDFTMEPISVVADNFNELVRVYPDINQPIYFVECGYSSSFICNSSELQQADFYREIFSAWDAHYDKIKYLTIFKTTDWSQADVDEFAIYYGISDIKFLEYLRTLGVRTWEGNGTNKLAYDAILCELKDRDWCDVTCTTSSPETLENNSIVNLYPNPTNGIINIKTDQSIKHVTLYNSLGEVTILGSNKAFDLTKLAKGIYFLNIRLENGGFIRERIVKE